MPYPHGLTTSSDATRNILRQQYSPDGARHGGCEIDVNRAIRLHITRRIEWTNKGGARRGGQGGGDEITHAPLLRWNRGAGDTAPRADTARPPASAYCCRAWARQRVLTLESQPGATGSPSDA